MNLRGEDYSPGLLKKIEYAGGNARSFQAAAESLGRLAECSISARHVERLTERLGKERAAERDQAAAAMEARKLRAGYKQPPAVAVVMLDAGKAQFRQEDAGPGVHQPHWGDTKVACLQTYSDVEYKQDPQPEPPEAFLDPTRVERLCREMERVRGAGGDKQPEDKTPEKPQRKKKRKKPRRRKRPERLVRTVVATTAPVEPFGWMVSAEAMKRKMYAAKKRAVVGDGGNWIEPLGQMHFAILAADPGFSASAGASVRGGAAGVWERRQGGVETVRADAAGRLGREGAGSDRYIAVAGKPSARGFIGRQGCLPRGGVDAGLCGAESGTNGLSALPADGPAGEQFAGGVADQADQPAREGDGAVLDPRRSGGGPAGSRGLPQPGWPGRGIPSAASAWSRRRKQPGQASSAGGMRRRDGRAPMHQQGREV